MKGSSCPFSHDVDVDAIAAVPAPELEAATKKQEEELRRLKEERKKEEERIARLKAEEAALQRKKNQEAKQARTATQKPAQKPVQKRDTKAVQQVYRPKASTSQTSEKPSICKEFRKSNGKNSKSNVQKKKQLLNLLLEGNPKNHKKEKTPNNVERKHRKNQLLNQPNNPALGSKALLISSKKNN